MLEARADIKARTADHSSQLHSAALGGHMESVKFLLNEDISDLEATGSEGCTSLLMSSFNGHLDIFTYLPGRPEPILRPGTFTPD
eukprot:11068075-Karenia_brevis.AAC.1